MTRRRGVMALWLLGACKQPEAAEEVQIQEGTVAPVAAPSTTAPVPVPTVEPVRDHHVEWRDAPADADFASTVRLERAKAERKGRTLVVYVGADWCPPCKAFHEAVLAGTVQDKLARTTFLVFDFDRDASRMGAYGYRTSYIPYFVKPGPDGRPEDSFHIKTLNGKAAVAEATAKLVKWQK